jgi:hypothetical protein
MAEEVSIALEEAPVQETTFAEVPPAEVDVEAQERTFAFDPEPDFTPIEDPDDSAQTALEFSVGFDAYQEQDQLVLNERILRGEEGNLRKELSEKVIDQNLEFQNMSVQEMAQVMPGTNISKEEVLLAANQPLETIDQFIVKEIMFGRNVTNVGFRVAEDSNMKEAYRTNETGADQIKDIAEDMHARQIVFLDLIKRGEQNLKNQNIIGTGVDYLKSVVPAYDSVKLQGLISEATGHPGIDPSILTGRSIEQQAQYLQFLPVDQMKEAATAAYESLAADNPRLALQFIRHMHSFSSSEAQLANLFTVVDGVDIATMGGIGGVVTLAKAGVKAVSTKGIKGAATGAAQSMAGASAHYANSAMNLLRTTAARRVSPAQVISAHGNYDMAGLMTAQQQLKEKLLIEQAALSPTHGVEAIKRDSRNMFVQHGGRFDGTKAHQEVANRVKAASISRSIAFMELLTGTENIGASTEAALSVAKRQAMEKLHRQYKDGAQEVYGVDIITPDKGVVNLETIRFKVGENGAPFTGTLEERTTKAVNARSHYFGNGKNIEKDVRLIHDGDETYLEVLKHVDQTDPLYREALLRDERFQTPEWGGNAMFSAIRNADNLSSDAMMINAKQSLLSRTAYLKLMAKMIQPYRKALRGKGGKELEAYMEKQRTHLKRRKDGKVIVGRQDQTVAEFETNFYTMHNRYPTEMEIDAYETFKDLTAFDLYTRNLNVYTGKGRRAIEEHVMKKAGPIDEATGQMRLLDTEGIEGKDLDLDAALGVIDNDGNSRILLVDSSNPDTDGSPYIAFHSAANRDRRDLERVLQDHLAKGGQIIQPNQFGKLSLEKEYSGWLRGEHPDLVLSVDTKTKPLRFNQVPGNDGGHLSYVPTGSFLKQGKVIKTFLDDVEGHRFQGDTSILHFRQHVDAEKMVPIMEAARVALKARDMTAFKAAVAKTPLSEKQVLKWFHKNKDGTSVLSLDEPIVAVRSGESTATHPVAEKHYEDLLNFRNPNDPESVSGLDTGVDLSMAVQRDKPLQEIVGSEDSPLYHVRQTKFVPLYQTTESALVDLADSRFFTDFRNEQLDLFIAEFGEHLDIKGGVPAIRANPLTLLNKNIWKATTPNKVEVAGRNNLSILNRLLNTESSLQKDIRHQHQKMMDVIYEKGGQKAFDLVPEASLRFIQDPTAYMRNVAFHSKIGLFNPVHLFLQTQSLANTIGIAGPRIGALAVPAGVQMMRLQFTQNKAIIREMAKKHAKLGKGFGWRADHFEEAYDGLNRSNWLHVGGEVASRDHNPQKLSTNLMHNVLDKGLIFFNTGEKLNRATAYTAAYQMWRRANPKATFDKAARRSVLNQADINAGQMTVASNAKWQRGFLNPATQFFAYNARIMEQMLPGVGKQLTGRQKAQVFGTYSVLYGIPTAVGAGLGFVPFYDMFREQTIKYGGDEHHNFVVGTLQNGLIETMAGIVGPEVNFAERHGPGNNQFWRDFLSGDKTPLELGFGVSGTVMKSMYQATVPTWHWLLAAASGDPEQFPLKTSDFAKTASIISSLGAASRLLIWMNTHRYITNNGLVVTDADVTTTEALMKAIVGVEPKRVQRAFDSQQLLTGLKEAKDEIGKLVAREFRMSLQFPLTSQDHKDHITRMGVLIRQGGLNPSEVSRILNRQTGLLSHVEGMKIQVQKKIPNRGFD